MSGQELYWELAPHDADMIVRGVGPDSGASGADRREGLSDMTYRIDHDIDTQSQTCVPPKFMCDEMLAHLGKYLRAAGYDTVTAESGLRDRELLAKAVEEDRILLTSDREFLTHRMARETDVFILPATGLDGAVKALMTYMSVDWLRAIFSRCLIDNTLLRLATQEEEISVPPDVRKYGRPVRTCPRCGRVYWPGSHAKRIRAKLENFQAIYRTEPHHSMTYRSQRKEMSMLTISSDKLDRIIMLAKEFTAQVSGTDPNSGSNPTDDLAVDVLESDEGSPIEEQLKDSIDGLNEDEKLDLVALCWIGRGTYDAEDLAAARETAQSEKTHSTSDYLLGTPLLADYLILGKDALDALEK